MPIPVLFLESSSGHTTNVTDEVAVATARSLVQTLLALRKSNKALSVNAPEHLSRVQLAPNKTLREVFAKPEHEDQWLLIRTLAANSPLSNGLDGWLDEVALWEAKTSAGDPSLALLWAHLCETGTVSLHVQPYWMSEWVAATCSSLDADAMLHTAARDIRNHSSPAHAALHDAWLRQLNSGTTAAAVWREREDRYPGLRLIGGVERHLVELSVIGAPYRQALETLRMLNEDALRWNGVGEPNFSVKVAAGEHDQRRELVVFRDDASGENREFGRHAYFTGGFAGRIHFIADPVEKRFVIGYVGKKL